MTRQNSEILEIEETQRITIESLAETDRKIASAESEQTREQSEAAEAAENLKIAREQADAMSAALAELKASLTNHNALAQ